MTQPDPLRSDLDLFKRVVYEEYYRVHPRDRQRSQWVMDQAMQDHLERLLAPPPPDPDDDPGPRTERVYLLGLPIEVREGVEGIHLERLPSSWYCAPVADVLAQAKAPAGWHERGCPHVDWSSTE